MEIPTFAVIEVMRSEEDEEDEENARTIADMQEVATKIDGAKILTIETLPEIYQLSIPTKNLKAALAIIAKTDTLGIGGIGMSLEKPAPPAIRDLSHESNRPSGHRGYVTVGPRVANGPDEKKIMHLIEMIEEAGFLYEG